VVSFRRLASTIDGAEILMGTSAVQNSHDSTDAGPVSYRPVGAGETLFWGELRRLINGGAAHFCEVGGGARPVVGLPEIQRQGLDYVLFDVSQEELDAAPAGYEGFQGSIIDPDAVSELMRRHGAFDVVLSRWTAEHVPDAKLFHEHVYELLRPGGTAIHFFPTLYSLPFLVNRLLSPDLSAAVLFRAFSHRQKKFPAYYAWCRGPSARQVRRFEEIGFSVDRYVGFFGHSMYARVKPLDMAQSAVTRGLLAHPLASLTSFALVVLTRPA
jgi:SAM-dependent methyltransferase